MIDLINNTLQDICLRKKIVNYFSQTWGERQRKHVIIRFVAVCVTGVSNNLLR